METQLCRQPHADQYLYRGLRERNLNQQHLFDRAESVPHKQSAPIHIPERPKDLQRTAQSKGQQQHLHTDGGEAGLSLSGHQGDDCGQMVLHCGSLDSAADFTRSVSSGSR